MAETKTAAKAVKPQDHKAKEPAPFRDLKKIPERALLTPIEELDTAVATKLIGTMYNASADGDESNYGAFMMSTGDAIAFISKNCVEDEEGWKAFNTLPNFRKVLELVEAYLGALGKVMDF